MITQRGLVRKFPQLSKGTFTLTTLCRHSAMETAIKAACNLVEILGRGGFRLIKFMSDSKDVMSAIPFERRALLDLSLHLNELPVERALGVRWFVQTDELGFESKNLNPLRQNVVSSLLSVLCMTLLVLLPLWPSLQELSYRVSGRQN